MKNKAIEWLNGLVNDNTPKFELDIIEYLKRLARADKGSNEASKYDTYIRELFEKFYALYLRKGSKEQAYKTWKNKLKKLKSEEEILEKARKIVKLYHIYALEWQESGRDKKYIPLCSSWLNANIPE